MTPNDTNAGSLSLSLFPLPFPPPPHELALKVHQPGHLIRVKTLIDGKQEIQTLYPLDLQPLTTG